MHVLRLDYRNIAVVDKFCFYDLLAVLMMELHLPGVESSLTHVNVENFRSILSQDSTNVERVTEAASYDDDEHVLSVQVDDEEEYEF